MTRQVSVLAALAIAFIGWACDRGSRDPGTPEGAAPQTAAQAAATPSAAADLPPGPPPEQLAPSASLEAIRASLPPLPVATFPLPRPASDVRLAYEFAALHPEVLKYVPCYCGCEQSGHQHNESCFIASREADGRVVAWDDHGMG
jgi:hypothetical protein